MTQRTIMFNLSDVWGPRHLDNFVMQMRLKCRQSELLFDIYNFCKYRNFSEGDNAVLPLLYYFNTILANDELQIPGKTKHSLENTPKRIAIIADSDSLYVGLTGVIKSE